MNTTAVALCEPPAATLMPTKTPHRGLELKYRRPLLVSGGVAGVSAIGYLLLPPMGTDLAAQTARGDFYAEHGTRLIDFGWYGGISPLGYSWFAAPANAALGARGVGALSVVIAALAFSWLLVRFAAKRPTVAGIAGALVFLANIMSGRTTFALGLAIGLLALCVVRVPRAVRRLWPGEAANGVVSQRSAWWDVAAFVLAVLATGASPVAGVFVVIAGGALALVGYWRSGAILIVGSTVGMLPFLLLFADGGVQLYVEDSMRIAAAACVITFFLLPAQQTVLRAGALLAALAVIGTYYVPTALGSNIMRLPMLFVVPLVIAYAQFSRPLLVGSVAALCWFHPPLMIFDVKLTGERAATKAYYEPLLDQLHARTISGRVEVVPLASHWESVYVAESMPLARGWLRQLDVEENPIFYNGQLDSATYQQWLMNSGVEYVALPQRAEIDFRGGRAEAELLREGLPYLTQVWENDDWRLFAVPNSTGIITAPGALISADGARIRFSVTEPGDVLVRVRWSRWLALHGPNGCVRPDDNWVTVQVRTPGNYELTSEFSPQPTGRCR